MAGEIDNRNCRNFYDTPSEKVSMEHSKYEKTEEGDIFIGVDEDGNEICRNVDSGYDGYYEYRSNLNEDGTTSEELVDRDHDGYEDIYVAYDYEKGAADGEESVRHIDYDLDGVSDVVTYLDGKGNITADDIDTDGDGEKDLHIDYVYDSNGNISQRVIDENGDGVPDVVSTVDVDGRILADDIDTDNDGILDTHAEYIYNDEGEIIGSTERSLIQASAETTIHSSFTVDGTRILNSKGEQIGIVITTEKDGEKIQTIYSFGQEIPKEDTVTFENGKYTDTDPEGRVMSEDFDSDGDGIIDTHVEYSYDSSGKQQKSRKTTLKPAPENVKIPPQCTVKGSRIIGPLGNQIGVIIKTIENGQEIQKIFLIKDEIT